MKETSSQSPASNDLVSPAWQPSDQHYEAAPALPDVSNTNNLLPLSTSPPQTLR